MRSSEVVLRSGEVGSIIIIIHLFVIYNMNTISLYNEQNEMAGCQKSSKLNKLATYKILWSGEVVLRFGEVGSKVR
jgi:hypothetical protein